MPLFERACDSDLPVEFLLGSLKAHIRSPTPQAPGSHSRRPPLFPPPLLSGLSADRGQELTWRWPSPRAAATPHVPTRWRSRPEAGGGWTGRLGRDPEVERPTASWAQGQTHTDVDPGPGAAHASEGRGAPPSRNGAVDRAADTHTGVPEAQGGASSRSLGPCAAQRCQRPGPRGPGCKH